MPTIATRALTALALLAASPACAEDGPITWRTEAVNTAGQVQLTLIRERPGSRHMNSSSVTAASLTGFAPRGSGQVSFRLSREAGSFDCRGEARGIRGEGQCDFKRDARFDETLARFGIARPSDEQSYQLAALDAHVETLATLQRLGFARATINDLMALTVHRADPAWLTGVAQARRQRDPLSDLVTYRIHGVTGDWLKRLTAADPALAHATPNEVAALKIHGVTPEWVEGLTGAGLRSVEASELAAMRIHGITPQFVRAAVSAGVQPSSNSLIGRKLHGGASWR